VSLSPVVISISTEPRPERFLKRLAGRTDIEDALKRLDRLTEEEARMAAVENLKISHSVRNIVINGAQAHLLASAIIHDLRSLRRKRGESDGDGNKIGYSRNGEHHRPNKVSVITYPRRYSDA
jgi:hypothetical protein